ncbi:hypothetical protein AYO43_03530 [Nitrospira sp. SCGC AG-212-E16]|nr:hypothetical protein AYO43_03530 [Nitrospira sp. SCGC AG-212-E16]
MENSANSRKSILAIVMEEGRPGSERQQNHDGMRHYQTSGPLIKSLDEDLPQDTQQDQSSVESENS